VYLASPCSIPWETMNGSERQRSCGGCSRTVFNISDMTRREAEAFLRENGSSACMKFYRRTDGTIMTDDCPRALRKLRDQCKFAARIAVGLVAFAVSFPAALAQSVQTRDTTPITDNVKRIESNAKNANQPSLDSPPMPGGLLPITMGEPMVKPVEVTPIVPGKGKATASVEARIVTKKHTLPNGKKVLLVAPDFDGKVVRVKSKRSAVQMPNQNAHLDKRAAEFYALAQKAQCAKNYELSEFYLEKTLETYDSQKGGDAGFRRLVENELKESRLRTPSVPHKKVD
jgi:hypothetical protein